MAIFAAVVEQGSFRAAAKHLGLAPSRISQTISDLEKALGVTLLYRSTRKLSLSSEGRTLFESVKVMLAAAEDGLDAIQPSSEEPSGELRVTAPAFITQTEYMDRIAAFAHTYPNVALKMRFSDHVTHLIRDGYDVAIRAGWLKNSEMRSRKIGEMNRTLVASAQYYSSMPPPSHPSDLEDWQWVRFDMRPDRTDMVSKDGDTASVVGRSNVAVDAAFALYEFVVRGLGVTEIPAHLANRAIERGDLVHVLPEWSVDPLGIYVVWPDGSRRQSLTLLFVRFLAEAD